MKNFVIVGGGATCVKYMVGAYICGVCRFDALRVVSFICWKLWWLRCMVIV